MDIPVTPLFLKIVKRDYAHCFNSDGIFDPPNLHLFHVLLNLTPPKTGAKCMDKIFAHSIQIASSPLTSRRNYENHLGNLLHKWAIDTFCRQIDILSIHHANISTIIRNYLYEYALLEEDYSFETAYRTYYKYKKKREQQSNVAYRDITSITSYDLRHIGDKIGAITAKHLDAFYHNDVFDTKLFIGLIYHILHKKFKYTLQEIAAIHQSTITKVYRQSLRARSHVVKHRELYLDLHSLD